MDPVIGIIGLVLLLAEAIGYPYASVRKFMCERYDSEAIANAIANYLNIER